MAYPFAAFAAGLIFEKYHAEKCCSGFNLALFASVPALAVVYLGGTCWMMLVTHTSPSVAILQTVAPFLLWDAAKAVCAALVASQKRMGA